MRGSGVHLHVYAMRLDGEQNVTYIYSNEGATREHHKTKISIKGPHTESTHLLLGLFQMFNTRLSKALCSPVVIIRSTSYRIM